VRLFTRNGHDWTDKYPLIVEAALRNRCTSFVIDGEAVLLGVDGRSACLLGLEGLVSKHQDRSYRPGRCPALGQDEEPPAPCDEAS